MEKNTHFDWKLTVRYGLLAGVVALSVSVIGMVELFAKRDLIAGVFTLGQVILFLAPVGLSYVIAGKKDYASCNPLRLCNLFQRHALEQGLLD